MPLNSAQARRLRAVQDVRIELLETRQDLLRAHAGSRLRDGGNSTTESRTLCLALRVTAGEPLTQTLTEFQLPGGLFVEDNRFSHEGPPLVRTAVFG